MRLYGTLWAVPEAGGENDLGRRDGERQSTVILFPSNTLTP